MLMTCYLCTKYVLSSWKSAFLFSVHWQHWQQEVAIRGLTGKWETWNGTPRGRCDVTVGTFWKSVCELVGVPSTNTKRVHCFLISPICFVTIDPDQLTRWKPVPHVCVGSTPTIDAANRSSFWMGLRLVTARCVYAYDRSVFVFAIPTGMECTVNTVCRLSSSCKKATRAISDLVKG